MTMMSDFNDVRSPFKSCRVCTKRYLGCHSSCKNYQEELKAHREIKNKMMEEDKMRTYEFNTKKNFKKYRSS